MQLTLRVDDRQVQKKLADLSRLVKDTKPLLDDMGEDLMKHFGEQVFESEGSANGSRWRPLAASTLRARAERTGYYKRTPIVTGKILTWTGRLKSSFKKTVTRTRLTISNTQKYFDYTSQKRPVFDINKTVIEIAIKAVEKHFKKIK